MAGKIKKMIDDLIEQRSKGSATVAKMVSAKLILKGIDPTKYNEASEDDINVITQIKEMAKEYEITL